MLFGAIVAMNGHLPSGSPLSDLEVLASTTFSSPGPSSDVTVPLSVALAPGDYALIFGSGLFGATGRGYMPFTNSDTAAGANSYFFWNVSQSIWKDSIYRDMRFFVSGHPTSSVPEPSTYVMAAVGLLGVGFLARRKKRLATGRPARSVAIVLVAALATLSISTESASAAFMFAEDFNSATPNPHLEGYSNFTVGGGVIRRDGSYYNSVSRKYMRTTGTNYNEADFRFELTFTTTPLGKTSINFIGLGRGDRGPSGVTNPYNEPYESLYFRIHTPDTSGGFVSIANLPVQSILTIGNLPTAGTHRALIEKVGNEITFAIDAHYNGTFASDMSHTFTDLAATAPFLDNTQSRLFFGTVYDGDSFDDWNVESIVPEPSTYVMAVLGLLGLGLCHARKKRSRPRRRG